MKKKILKGSALLLSAASLLTAFTACGEEEKKPDTGGIPIADRAVSLTETETEIVMENGNVSLSLNRQNGNIKEVVCMGREVGLVNGGGANFSLTIDPTTDDVFRANHVAGSAIVLKSKDFTPQMQLVRKGDDASVELTYDLSYQYGNSSVTGITVKSILSMERKGMFFTLEYQIENKASAECVIVNFTGAQMSGIRTDEGEDWSLFYPYKEGKIYDSIVSLINDGTRVGTKLTASYPSPMSMQLMQVFNESVSFDYSVLDTEGIYKEFCFGKFTGNKEYDQGGEVGYQISMACTQYPFVKTGDTVSLSPYRIGVGTEGGWYEGADRYRNFLLESGMTKEKNKLTEKWTGMANLTAQGNTGSLFATYENSPAAVSNYVDWIGQANSYGIDTLCAIGWNEGGFDHNYPDYAFSEVQGGEESFGRMVSTLHGNGDSIICYLNAHIADEESGFASQPSAGNASLTKLQAGAVKKVGFEYGVTSADSYEKYMYYESYAGGLSAYAMSPASSDFQEAILSAVQRLADKGVNGIWFDQLMEMPAYLDYDSSHGAKNPATAYSEGYRKLLSECVGIMETATDGNCIFVCEGVCDAYIKYIDCCGMMWARKLGATDSSDKTAWNSALTRYTMPCLMLGIEGVGTTVGSANEFARAFVLGNPLLASNYQESVSNVITTYRSAESIYFYGRYMDKRGLRIGSEDVVSSLIVGSDGSIGLQVYNDGKSDLANVKVMIDPESLGLNGKIVSVVNLMTGDRIEMTAENTFSLSVKSFAIGAYKIQLEEDENA